MSSGGIGYVSAGGTARATTLDVGALEQVLSGGMTSDTTVNGQDRNEVTYEAVFAGGMAVSTTVIGNGETASLTEAANLSSGTLTVTNGAEQVHLTLLGHNTGAAFMLSNDGTGDTLVTHT